MYTKISLICLFLFCKILLTQYPPWWSITESRIYGRPWLTSWPTPWPKTELCTFWFDQGSPATLQGSSTVGSNVRNLSQQQVSAPFQTFGENNYKRIISFPIAQCCMPYPPWTAARGHGRSKISHTAWGGQWQWQWQWQWQMIGCPARIGSSLGATWSGSIDAWARGRGERSLFSLVDWL